LQQLLTDASKAGTDLKIISAYRSFGEQGALKNGYTVTYGSGANKFSADQGYSEHQLGTTVDFTTSKLGTQFTAFAKTDSFKWLEDNAYRYGFVLSYPESNTYYQFEPWHWRFVGKSLAAMLHEEKQNFYDLSQSKIDSYLINIFD
jgi:D-alanyl-D-alanine carboxypeptidase